MRYHTQDRPGRSRVTPWAPDASNKKKQPCHLETSARSRRADRNRRLLADAGAVIWEMACSSWEEPGNHWLSYVVDAGGQVVATAIFGPEDVLLVTISDGRRLRFPMPELYRD